MVTTEAPEQTQVFELFGFRVEQGALFAFPCPGSLDGVNQPNHVYEIQTVDKDGNLEPADLWWTEEQVIRTQQSVVIRIVDTGSPCPDCLKLWYEAMGEQYPA